MPRLVALLPKNGLALPGIRANQMSQILLHAPGTLEDWRFHLQGPSVLFESPAGWEPGKRPTGRGARIVYSLPRADFYLYWKYDEGEEIREPINWTDPGKPKSAPEEPEPQPELAPVVQVAEATADTVVAEHYQAPAEPEPEVADPDDADDLPMPPPAKKGQRR